MRTIASCGGLSEHLGLTFGTLLLPWHSRKITAYCQSQFLEAFESEPRGWIPRCLITLLPSRMKVHTVCREFWTDACHVSDCKLMARQKWPRQPRGLQASWSRLVAYLAVKSHTAIRIPFHAVCKEFSAKASTMILQIYLGILNTAGALHEELPTCERNDSCQVCVSGGQYANHKF